MPTVLHVGDGAQVVQHKGDRGAIAGFNRFKSKLSRERTRGAGDSQKTPRLDPDTGGPLTH